MAVILTRDAILNAKPVTKDVENVFGGTVRLRTLSLNQRIALADAIDANHQAYVEWQDDQTRAEDERKGVAKVTLYDQAVASIIFAICDENGEQMFTFADYDMFAVLDYPDIVRLWMAFQELNIRSSVEDQKKSSGRVRTASSSSGSRRTLARR